MEKYLHLILKKEKEYKNISILIETVGLDYVL